MKSIVTRFLTKKIHGAVNEKKTFDRNFLYVFSLLDLIILSILQKQLFAGALQNVLTVENTCGGISF